MQVRWRFFLRFLQFLLKSPFYKAIKIPTEIIDCPVWHSCCEVCLCHFPGFALEWLCSEMLEHRKRNARWQKEGNASGYAKALSKRSSGTPCV